MFAKGEIWAYPTDTSFGLGVRADDFESLETLNGLKGRDGKLFSLMCADATMLKRFAQVPADFDVLKFFSERPRTAIFKPSGQFPTSKFWPPDSVAFRVSTIPEVAKAINFPITATSANFAGEPPIFTVAMLKDVFGDKIKIFDKFPELPEKPPSEIWDFTKTPPVRLR